MMIGLVRGLFFCTGLAATNATAVQSVSPPNDQSPIVVTGKRTNHKELQDFVRALTPVPFGGQIARFEQSVCPVALGLPQPQAIAVASRMRRVAQGIGIRVGGKDCYPNVVVVVTQNKQNFMQELRGQRAEYFGSMPLSKVRELARQPGPAAAWQLQGPPVNARGVEIYYDPNYEMYINRTTESASRIHAAARPQFDGAVVVVERGSLAGLTATQLADYAAMRAFAGSDPSRIARSAPPTILRILEAPMGSEVPLSLTEWDLGFLRGLYSAPRNLHTGAQRSAIQRDMTQDVERPVAE